MAQKSLKQNPVDEEADTEPDSGLPKAMRCAISGSSTVCVQHVAFFRNLLIKIIAASNSAYDQLIFHFRLQYANYPSLQHSLVEPVRSARYGCQPIFRSIYAFLNNYGKGMW